MDSTEAREWGVFDPIESVAVEMDADDIDDGVEQLGTISFISLMKLLS